MGRSHFGSLFLEPALGAEEGLQNTKSATRQMGKFRFKLGVQYSASLLENQ